MMLRKSRRIVLWMRVSAIASFICTLVVLPPVSLAERIDCNNPQDSRQVEDCAKQSYQTLEQDLNKVYQDLVDMVNNQERILLAQAQKAWIQLKDLNCDFEVHPVPVESRHLSKYKCLERMTQERITELQRQISGRNFWLYD